MAQKAVRSEASSPNSLGPERDWPEVRGEECRPRTVLSWLLAKWVVGESEEAGRRTLSSHGPENPEEKEIALSLRRWVLLALGPAAEQKQNETEDSPPGPPPGEGAALFSPSPEKEQTPTSPGCPRQGRFVDFLDDLGPGWDAGVPLSCERLDGLAYVSIRPGAEQLWRSQEGAHGDGQTEAWQRWMVHHAGAGCAGSPRSAAVPPRTAGRSPRRCRRTALPGRSCISSCINPGSVLPSCTCLSALAW